MKEKTDLFDYDVEDEYIIRRLSGEEIEVGKFLDKYKLDGKEKHYLVRRFQRWEESMVGFKQYYKSIDLDAVFKKIVELSGMNVPPPKLAELWNYAIYVFRHVSNEASDFMLGSAWKFIPEAGMLSDEGLTSLSLHTGQICQLTEGPLAGTEIELKHNNRLIIRLNRPVSESSQLRLADKDGKTVELPVVYKLDRIGRIIYDLSGICELPPFEIQLITPKN